MAVADLGPRGEMRTVPEPTTLVAVGTGFVGLLTHLARRYFELAKEIFDIVVGSVLLVLAAPFLAVCALLIKVSSRGPVFFCQTRLGKNG
jgi:lipopolysaccharide/colanic/teichoic acid biosynthesis glycosyltransferase